MNHFLRIDNDPAPLRDRATAEKMIAELSAGDEDWTYSIVEIGNDRGLVRIDIIDEAGDFVGSI